MPGRTTIVAVAFLTLTTIFAPPFAAAPQSDTIRRLGRASQNLTAADLIDIRKLVSQRGQPWFVIADFPSHTSTNPTWRWTVQAYLFPTSAVTGPVVRGDLETVGKHLRALSGHESALEVYRAMSVAAADIAANCDGSTVAPVLNANDFQCFLNKFAAGCP